MIHKASGDGVVESALSRQFFGKSASRVVRLLAQHLVVTATPGGPPFDPFRHAAALGIRVDRENIRANGYLAGWPGPECRIVLRQRDETESEKWSRRRENFTLAHEIGHYVLRSTLRESVPASIFARENEDEEKLCNTFAEELLMPGFHVYDDLRSCGLKPRKILDLCDVYQVSLKALLRRLAVTLKNDFFAAIWSKGSRRFELSWATPWKFRELLLCDTGRTTVELAYSSNEVEFGRDCFLAGGKRMYWECSSLRFHGPDVLTLGIRRANRLDWLPPQQTRSDEEFQQVRLPVPLQLELPLFS